MSRCRWGLTPLSLLSSSYFNVRLASADELKSWNLVQPILLHVFGREMSGEAWL